MVEILVTLAIITILLTMGITSFREFNEKYRVESETKQLYADLMEARARAMQRNRAFFVRIWGNGYETFEDTSTAPDGNGSLDTPGDAITANVTGLHTIITTGLPGTQPKLRFNRNGIASVAPADNAIIRFTSTSRPDYDCITIRPTRIKLGQYSGGSCIEQ